MNATLYNLNAIDVGLEFYKKTLQAIMAKRCIHRKTIFFQTLDANRQHLLSRILMQNAVQW